MKCDELKRKYSDITGPYYGCNEVDEAIAELKDKCQMHDFFWEGCGFAKRGFKNAIAVDQYVEDLEAENAELKQKLEDVKASHYAEMVDAGMRERRLRRALWLARANNARNSYLKWNLFANFESEYNLFTIDEFDESPGVTDFSTLRTYEEWYKVWQNVERKCRVKAEEYK